VKHAYENGLTPQVEECQYCVSVLEDTLQIQKSHLRFGEDSDYTMAIFQPHEYCTCFGVGTVTFV
jgi:hypothetical protein